MAYGEVRPPIAEKLKIDNVLRFLKGELSLRPALYKKETGKILVHIGLDYKVNFGKYDGMDLRKLIDLNYNRCHRCPEYESVSYNHPTSENLMSYVKSGCYYQGNATGIRLDDNTLYCLKYPSKTWNKDVSEFLNSLIVFRTKHTLMLQLPKNK